NFIISANLASIKRERESIGAGIDADDLRETNIVTELSFEGFSLSTKNIASAGENTGKRLVDLTAMSLEFESGSGLGNECHKEDADAREWNKIVGSQLEWGSNIMRWGSDTLQIENN